MKYVSRTRLFSLLAVVILLTVVFSIWSPAAIIQAIIPLAVPTVNRTASGTAKFAVTDSSENLVLNGSYTAGNGGSTIGALDLKDPVNGGIGTLSWPGSASNFAWNLPAVAGTIPLISGTPTVGNCAQWVTANTIGQAAAACGSGGGGGTPGSTLFSSTTTAGPSNSAAETSLIGTVTGSKTIAANTFTNGAVIETRAQGFFSLPTVADSLTLKLKCGSTVLASASTTLPAGALTNGTFRLWLMVTAQGTGASGAFMTNGLAEFSGSALAPSELKVLNTSTVAFDFTTSCVMDMTAQWAGAQVGESISGTNAAAWIPGAPVTSVNGLTGAVVISGGGSVTPTTFAALPGTCTSGALYLFTNSAIGSAVCGASNTYTYFKDGFGSITPPTVGAFSAVNSPITSGTNGGVVISSAPASADNLRMLMQAVPGVPYTATACLLSPSASANFLPSGIALYDGTKIATLGLFNNTGGNGLYALKYNSVTSFSGTYTSVAYQNITSPFCVRLKDDGTNRIYSWSVDNVNFLQLTSVGRTDFLTPTQIGFFTDANSSTNTSLGWFFHYSVTTP